MFIHNPKSKIQNAEFGFTLVEMLVVIGIIAVLAGVIVPVLAKSREKGRQVNCGANLKQIGQALEMYAADNDQRLPDSQPCYWTMPACGKNTAAVWDGTTAQKRTAIDLSWQGAIMQYVKDKGIFVCPSRQALNYDKAGATGYGYNGTFWNGVQDACGNIVGTADNTSGLDGYRKITGFQDPSHTIMVTDSDSNGKPEFDGGTDTTGKKCPSDFGGDEKPEARHNGGFNALFADGHVKWKRIFRDYEWTVENDSDADITCP